MGEQDRTAGQRSRKPSQGRSRISSTNQSPSQASFTPANANDFGDGSSCERKLLLVLSDPGNLRLTGAELCKKAGISRDTYWRLNRSPDFQRKRRSLILAAMRDISPQIHALLESAKCIGPKGTADRRLLFQMADFYHPKNPIVEEDPSQQDGDMPDEEALWYYQLCNYPKENWLPSIRQRYEAGTLLPRAPETFA